MPGLLQYPMFYAIRDAFMYQKSLWQLHDKIKKNVIFKNQHAMGSFLDNHDQQRFLYKQKDLWLYKNALIFTLFTQGIPIIYYGTEQEFNGGDDPWNREPLWRTGFKTNTEMYKFLSKVIETRKTSSIWQYEAVSVLCCFWVIFNIENPMLYSICPRKQSDIFVVLQDP
jgi:alpha-amylase